MKVRDVMSSRPIVVGEGARDARHLMELGRVRHVPVVEGTRLLGLWMATEEGPVVLLGPDQVREVDADDPASEAMDALVAGAEAVLVWDAGVPAGMLTREDLSAVVRSAVAQGIGRRHPRPVVARLVGPAGAGKTTLLVRTLALLGRLRVAVVQANAAVARDAGEIAGARAVDDPAAHWRAGLSRAVERLADTELILVEDLDGPLELGRGIGEDLLVAVVPAAHAGDLTRRDLEEAQALVLTRADEVGDDALGAALSGVRERCGDVRVFTTAAAHDDRGLAAWVDWLGGEALRRRG